MNKIICSNPELNITMGDIGVHPELVVAKESVMHKLCDRLDIFEGEDSNAEWRALHTVLKEPALEEIESLIHRQPTQTHFLKHYFHDGQESRCLLRAEALCFCAKEVIVVVELLQDFCPVSFSLVDI